MVTRQFHGTAALCRHISKHELKINSFSLKEKEPKITKNNSAIAVVVRPHAKHCKVRKEWWRLTNAVVNIPHSAQPLVAKTNVYEFTQISVCRRHNSSCIWRKMVGTFVLLRSC